MQKIFVSIEIVLVFAACSPGKKLISANIINDKTEITAETNTPPAKNFTTYTADQYIQRFKNIAIEEMNLNGIPASITLGQALVESSKGNSELARNANNHFGIKSTPSWKGKCYYKDDEIKHDCYRLYDSPEESYRDHSAFLKRKIYARLFTLNITDYVGWAHGLKDAGYASDPNYAQSLIAVIQKYSLFQFDQPCSYAAKVARADSVHGQLDTSGSHGIKDTIAGASVVSRWHVVKQGDTLYNIAKRYGLNVNELKQLNGLDNNSIKIGQKLIIAN